MTVKERFKHSRPGSRLLYSARPLYLERPEALNTHSQPAPLHIERSLQKPGNVRSVAVSLRDEWRRCAPLTKAEVKALFEKVHQMVTSGNVDGEDLGKLAVFAGVHKFPARVKCAILPWHAVIAAMEGKAEPVTTEGGET